MPSVNRLIAVLEHRIYINVVYDDDLGYSFIHSILDFSSDLSNINYC